MGFDCHAWSVLGQRRGRGQFLNVLGALMIFHAKSVFLAVNASLCWLKGIDRPFGGGVESILIRSVFVNWRLGKFFYLILNGLHHKISKKLLYAA